MWFFSSVNYYYANLSKCVSLEQSGHHLDLIEMLICSVRDMAEICSFGANQQSRTSFNKKINRRDLSTITLEHTLK